MGFPNLTVEVAFNNGSDETLYATQGWAEITPWVKSMSGSLRGREYEVNRSEAGTVTAVLDNTDGEFTPGNAASPFYPNIKANRRFRVRGKNMAAPNVARGGGADRSTVFFERPVWSNEALTFSDNFDRTGSSGWGVEPNTSLTWAHEGGATSIYSTNGTVAQTAVEVANASRHSYISASISDIDIVATVSVPVAALGAAISLGISARRVDASNLVYAELQIDPTNAVNLKIQRMVGGVFTSLATVVTGIPHVAGKQYKIRFRTEGTTLKAKVWLPASPQPTAWTLIATDTVWSTAGGYGTRAALATGNTNTLPVIASFDDISVISLDYTAGVSDPVWKQHDPASYPALPAELTDHIEVTVAPGTYSGFRRLVSWIVPLEIGVRLAHSSYVWKVAGTEPGGTEGRFEIFYFDNDDVDIITSTSGTYGLNRPMERYTTGTPTVPTRKAFSHAPIGTAKYARVVWSVYYGTGTVISAPITYAITGIQTELPANLAPNPNADWDVVHWLSRGGTEVPVTTSDSLQFTWGSLSTVGLYQPIPHLIPGEFYAVTAQVALGGGSPDVMLTADDGNTGEVATAPAVVATDDFTRTVAAGSWGSPTLGGTWTLGGGAVGTAAVNGTKGTHTIAATGSFHDSILTTALTTENLDGYAEVTIPVLVTGTTAIVAGVARYYNSTNGVFGELVVAPDNSVRARIYLRSGFGDANMLDVVVAGLTHSAGMTYKIRFQAMGNRYRLAIWDGTQVVTPVWNEVTTNWFAASTNADFALRSYRETGNTNASPVISWDNVSVYSPPWSTLETYFQAGQPQSDIELMPLTDPTDTTIFVRGLNVQRVSDPTTQILSPEVLLPQAVTAYERPKDIFEGWIERWPWKVDEDETSIVVVDRLKRVGAIELANIVMETLLQDVPGLIIPMNDDPTNFNGTLAWQGEWSELAEATALSIVSTKGDLLTSSYQLGVEGPTEEPGMLWAPASSTVGYSLRLPFSSDFTGVVTPPPKPPPSAPPPPDKKQYTKTYYATWSRSYDSDGTTRWDDSPYLYHGCYFCSNNQRSLVGFNWAAIKADLVGATVVSMYFTMKNAHARWNRGLSVNLGYHNYSSKPSTWSGATVSESKWKVYFGEMEKRSIGIPTYVGEGFKAGTVKGFAVGPAPSDITDNYGFFYGATHSAKPYITITYTK